MRSVVRGTLSLTLRVLAGVLAALALSAVFGPWVLDRVEAVTGSRLVFDMALRSYILIAGAAWLLGFTVAMLARPTQATVLAWAWVAAAGASIAFVCMADLHHPLETEYSWIRYTTAACLLAAAALSWRVSRHEHRSEPGQPLLARVWAVMAFALTFLAADELFQIHEETGLAIARVAHLPHAFLDYITIGYAVIGLAVALWIGPKILPRYVRDHPAVLRMFGAGAALFMVAQVLDTTDRWFLPWLRGVAERFTTQPPRLLSDTWYLLWAPKRTFNTVEEVLENMAAAVFAAAVTVLLLERRSVCLPARVLVPRPRASAALGVALAVACVGAIACGRPSLWASSPALDRPARRLIGAEDGLLHADEAAYAPRWGVVVANEGVGNVILARNGKVTTLPPPAGIGAELDAVAADDHAIYASLPEVGAIYRYRPGAGWEPLATRKDGLGAPEGMVVVDSLLYSVDEHLHRLYRVSLDTGHVTSLPLDDKRCVYPEALAFHRGLGELLITDDKLGNVLAVGPTGSARVFASRAEGVKGAEDVAVAADGDVFLADPARREVTEFTQNGRVLRHVRFSRMYGDVVGVEVVGSGARERLYVVSGDASKNDAFVPSALWELAIPAAKAWRD